MKPKEPDGKYAETFFDYPRSASEAQGNIGDEYEWFFGKAYNRRKTWLSVKSLLMFFEGILERIYYPLASDRAIEGRTSLADYFRSGDAIPFHAVSKTAENKSKRSEIGAKFCRAADHSVLHEMLKDVYGIFHGTSKAIVLQEDEKRPQVSVISWSPEKFVISEESGISPDSNIPVGVPFDTCAMTWGDGLWYENDPIEEHDEYMVVKPVVEDHLARIGILSPDVYYIGYEDFSEFVYDDGRESLIEEIEKNTKKNWFEKKADRSQAKMGPSNLSKRSHWIPIIMMQFMVAAMRYLNYTTNLEMVWTRKRTKQKAYYLIGLGANGNMVAAGGIQEPVEEESEGQLEGWKRVTYDALGFNGIYRIEVPTSCGEKGSTPFLWKTANEINGMEDVGGSYRRWRVGKAILNANNGQPEIESVGTPFLSCMIDTLVPEKAVGGKCKGPEGWPAERMRNEGRVKEVKCTAFDLFENPDEDERLGNVAELDVASGDWDNEAVLHATKLLNDFPGKYKHTKPPEVLQEELNEVSEEKWADVWVEYSTMSKPYYKDDGTGPYYIPTSVYRAGGIEEPIFGKKVEYRLSIPFYGDLIARFFGPGEEGPYWKHEHAGCVGTIEYDFKNFAIDYDA